MSSHQPATIQLQEGRFARLEAIEWWDQSRLQQARVLVIGAGALGNEVIKNLALLGVGNLLVVDMDHVELSNLSRSVLFREADEGRPKAECAAHTARQIYPAMNIRAVVANVLSDVGLGCFRWADVVIGALDNREARVFVNSACARVGRPWIDGGIEVLQGVVRGFAPPVTACYECTMSQVDWDLLNKRRSCSLLARRAISQQGTPTTPTTASIIAALQVQELIKVLHGMEAMLGRGFVFDGAGHSSYNVTYPISPDCPWHEPATPIQSLAGFNSATPLQTIWDEAAEKLGGVDALDFGRELVQELICPACNHRSAVLQSVEKITAAQVLCGQCGAEATPSFFHSLAPGSELLSKTVAQIGLPAREIIWARRGAESIGIEMAGDDIFPRSNAITEKITHGT
jgi:molybdopterin/thiamine biosynthesis adenylyltransferase